MGRRRTGVEVNLECHWRPPPTPIRHSAIPYAEKKHNFKVLNYKCCSDSPLSLLRWAPHKGPVVEQREYRTEEWGLKRSGGKNRWKVEINFSVFVRICFG